MEELTREEYRELKKREDAGTVSSLYTEEMRQLYRSLGATHWVVRFSEAGPSLGPAVIVKR